MCNTANRKWLSFRNTTLHLILFFFSGDKPTTNKILLHSVHFSFIYIHYNYYAKRVIIIELSLATAPKRRMMAIAALHQSNKRTGGKKQKYTNT